MNRSKTDLARIWREVNGGNRWPSDVDDFVNAVLAVPHAALNQAQITNTGLIAAAPDLLDALQLLLHEEEAGTVCEIDRATARAAIAKATA